MDVFELRESLIAQYQAYATSFMRFRDEHIEEHVNSQLESGRLWKDPQVGLNPAFEPGGTLDELVASGLLHEKCEEIFQAGKSDLSPIGHPMTLHRHQVEGIERARAGKNYVLTTGTGSGKSLSYIIPIVDHVLRNGSGSGPQAIIVYPMNALANSQEEELRKFVDYGPWSRSPVTFARYTGQEDFEAKQDFLEQPPDIILTNYVMLELILTRQREKRLVRSFGDLRFLVLDELHTYRGRQGADVALLVRRLREASGSSRILTVGTSATMSSEGLFADRQAAVARVASKLFGSPVQPEDVVGETLRRATPEWDFTDPSQLDELRAQAAGSTTAAAVEYEGFVADPLSSWIESEFGLKAEPDGRLVRAVPKSIGGESGGAHELARLTGVDRDVCAAAIKQQLLAGYKVKSPAGFPAFAFRLHQFLSRGDTVYAPIGEPGQRYLTINEQRYAPGGGRRTPMFPLAFCRECGQEYYLVNRVGQMRFEPRRLFENVGSDDTEAGFLYIGEWPDHEDNERLPEEWRDPQGNLLKNHRANVPVEQFVGEDGTIDASGTRAQWFEAPFRFCLHCGVSYAARKGSSDFTRLGQLGTEGRSTATTILGLAAIRFLRDQSTIVDTAKKLLSFTDNRQDASLQAGHFNDFVQVTMLRAALWSAAREAGEEGLTHDEVAKRVFEHLRLPSDAYMIDPSVKGQARANAERVLREVLEYRVFADLERGWRLTQPNLEQCGLLSVEYPSLDELADDEEEWANRHAALGELDAAGRYDILLVLLDWMRRHLAIKTPVLNQEEQEGFKRRSENSLTGPWSLGEDRLVFASSVQPRGRKNAGADRTAQYLTGRGSFGQYLRRSTVLGSTDMPKTSDTDDVIKDLLDALRTYGLVEVVDEDRDGTPHYQIPAGSLRWVAHDGEKPYHDPLRTPTAPPERKTNEFFVSLYSSVGDTLSGLEAREHTAQVEPAERIAREDKFRRAELPVLFCSPTMELGVDISQLNVVNMRNVPPTPANYAQRSGRAGRSGQPALVFTYAAAQSPHDQWYFERPELMVAGVVEAPRLELANEDLLRAHVQAVWLSESRLDLGNGLGDKILDLAADEVDPPLFDSVIEELQHQPTKDAARVRIGQVLNDLHGELELAPWWHDDWVDDCLADIEAQFVDALRRWKGLYTSALQQADEQQRVILAANTPPKDRNVATRLRREAENQLDLLRSESASRSQADFNAYRYFASEGFLPGYSFPRLPLAAYIPGQRGKPGDFKLLQRPRFLAVREFGPHSLIYHEGSRYRVNRVIMPVGEAQASDGSLLTHGAKRCPACGYLHPIADGEPVDLCVRCKTELPSGWSNLFRLDNVSTVRRDRISSDEEERQRVGYDIVTGVRFAVRDGELSVVRSTLSTDQGEFFEMSYGDTANIWRINRGWRRRSDKHEGFVLDVERGYWSADGNAASTGDEDDPLSKRTERVIPFVEDSRNALLVQPKVETSREEMATLQAALKRSFELVFQLEDNEIAAEPLPSFDERNLLLFCESSEGGAGVLRRLLDEPESWQRVAEKALELVHVNPESGDSIPTRNGDPCEAACYECLLSYANQPEHPLVDRWLIIETLQQLRSSSLSELAGPTVATQSERAAPPAPSSLSSVAGLPADFVAWLQGGGYRLPDNKDPYLVEAVGETVDFVYRDKKTVVFIDGVPLDRDSFEHQRAKVDQKFKDAGIRVIRFGHRDDWAQLVDTYQSIFGTGAE